MSGKDSRSLAQPQNSISVRKSRSETVFRQRLDTWRELHLQYGPGRSYPYSWRLPELAKPFGGAACDVANRAYALDLFTLGRAQEAWRVMGQIPPSHDHEIEFLRARVARSLGIVTRSSVLLQTVEQMWLCQMDDQAQALLSMAESIKSEEPWAPLLTAWARICIGSPPDIKRAHQALVRLRYGAPTLAARGEALWAEALFRQEPRWALVWLEHALDCCEVYSQHDLRPRLLKMKVEALAANGELQAARRCEGELHSVLARFHGDASEGSAKPWSGGQSADLIGLVVSG